MVLVPNISKCDQLLLSMISFLVHFDDYYAVNFKSLSIYRWKRKHAWNNRFNKFNEQQHHPQRQHRENQQLRRARVNAKYKKSTQSDHLEW